MMSNWTKLLIRFFRSKDEKTRELRLMAPESLENLMAENRGATVERVEFNIASVIISRLIQLLVNLV